MQPTFSFNGIYKDSFGEEQITVTSDGVYITTIIRGIKFEGGAFDNLHIKEDGLNVTNILPVYDDDLTDCYFNIKIPLHIQVEGNTNIYYANYETWNTHTFPTSKYLLSITINSEIYQSNESFFGEAIGQLRKQLPENIKIKCCLLCRLSVFRPYETQTMGELICFKSIKEDFMQIDWKKNRTLRLAFYDLELDKRPQIKVTENYYCSEYFGI